MSLCAAKGFLELPTVLGLPWASPPLPALPWCPWDGGCGARTCCAGCRTLGRRKAGAACVSDASLPRLPSPCACASRGGWRDACLCGVRSSSCLPAWAPCPWCLCNGFSGRVIKVGEDWAPRGGRPEVKSCYMFMYIILYTILKMAKPRSCLCERVLSVISIQLQQHVTVLYSVL